VLNRFAKAYHISYPMLSDQGSVVIRKFGILNTNVPPDVTRFYGIPFPGQYLIAPDRTVEAKYFMPDYQERPTASEVLLTGFNTGGTATTIKAEDVTVKIAVSDSRSFSGHQLGIRADFDVAPGWHVYGAPLPQEYTVTKVKFDDSLVQKQSLKFPPPKSMKFEALGQTFPVYTGNFDATGTILLKQKLAPGDYQLTGTVEFQECNDSICKIPQSVHFALPLKIEPMVGPAKS
jgi:hypothetical protein